MPTFFTRRQFIHQTTLASGVLVMPSWQNLLLVDEPRKLRVALVGLGNYSTHQLAPALQATEWCQLAGIVTGSPEKAKAWAKQYAISAKNSYTYQTFDQIKDNPDIDIVYIVLPNFLHAEYTIRAAQAGKHVICEKPMAMDVVEAKQMIQACKQAGVQLSVGYRLYFEPHHQQMQQLARDKTFGQVKMIESSLGFTLPNPTSWRLNKKMGGGAMMDLGIYAIQGARRTLGEDPIRVTAQAFTLDTLHFKGIHETVFWQFEFASGAVAHSSTSYSSYVDRLYATGEKGWFKLEPSYNAVGAKGETSQGPMTVQSPTFQQIKQLDAFALSIINKTKPLASGEEGLKDMQIIESVLQAAQNGRVMTITY